MGAHKASYGHKALFSGDLEFSCKVFTAGWWFSEGAHGGVAWQNENSVWGGVKVGMAAFIAAGFVLGGLIGAYAAQQVPGNILRRVFGAVMLLASLKMIFFD
jgi:uncharacterized membrane protein YfcA